MDISVDNRHVVVADQRCIERFSISHIRKTQKIVRSFVTCKDSRGMKALALWMTAGAAVSFVAMQANPGAGAELFLAVFASILIWAVWKLLSDPAYRKRTVHLYWGLFVSGDNEKYSIVSRSEELVDGFLSALNAAMRDAIAQVYNVSIDNSMNSANVSIDKLINQGGGSVSFYEGEIPKDGRS